MNEFERQETNIKKQDKTWQVISIICAIISTLFFPPFIGGFGIFAGYKTKEYNKKLGNILMITNVITIIIGMALGVLASILLM